MPVPASGEISLGKIRQELESTGTGDDYDNGPYTTTQTSLKLASEGFYDTINTANDADDRPDGSDPHNITEFYNYDHNLSGFSLGFSLWGFDDQHGATSYDGVLWTPTYTHSEWVNGRYCVLPISGVRRWEAGDPQSQRGWYIDYDRTPSPNTGPHGAAPDHSQAQNTRYLYTEQTGGHWTRYHVCRSPGHNFHDAMSDTSNDLNVRFYYHMYGVDIDQSTTLRLYHSRLPAANHASSTLLHTITDDQHATYTTAWSLVDVDANSLKTNQVEYLYFVLEGADNYAADVAIDSVGVWEDFGGVD